MRRPGGFTLVEVLVALALFGLLAGATVGVFAYAVDHRERVAERIGQVAEWQRATALLRQDLAQVAVRRVRDADGRPRADAFTGSPSGEATLRLSFVRRGWENADQQPRPSLQRVEYRLEEGRLERVAFAALDGAEPLAPQVLLRDIRAWRIAYHHEGQWAPAWTGGLQRLPDAIALTLDLEPFGSVRHVVLVGGGP